MHIEKYLKKIDLFYQCCSYLGKGMIPVPPEQVFEALKNPRTRYTYDEMLKVHAFICFIKYNLACHRLWCSLAQPMLSTVPHFLISYPQSFVEC